MAAVKIMKFSQGLTRVERIKNNMSRGTGMYSSLDKVGDRNQAVLEV